MDSTSSSRGAVLGLEDDDDELEAWMKTTTAMSNRMRMKLLVQWMREKIFVFYVRLQNPRLGWKAPSRNSTSASTNH